jgi:hypothetical protein
MNEGKQLEVIAHIDVGRPLEFRVISGRQGLILDGLTQPEPWTNLEPADLGVTRRISQASPKSVVSVHLILDELT